MDDHRTADDIERGLERDRAGLADTLDDLRDKFSLDAIFRQATDQFREHGGDIGASVSRAVKDNPMALALTGVGLAWLIFGDTSGKAKQSGHDRGYDATDRMRGHGVGRPLDNAVYGRSATMTGATGAGNIPLWARDVDEPHSVADAHQRGSDHDGLGARASDAAVAVRDGAAHAAATTRDRASSLWDRLAEGTEQLSEEGRDRVIAARERVHHARGVAMDRARKGQDSAADMFDEQPLIAGMLALAVGAAIAAALPRTAYEDDRIGAQSDELFHEAERIFAEEREKIGAVIGAAMDEARDIASETGSSVQDAAQRVKVDADRQAASGSVVQDAAEQAKDSIRDAGKRISDTAMAEADKQNLGKVRS